MYHLTLSKNEKTGSMFVSTQTKDTCPDTCSLKNNGCYAENSFLGLHWKKVTDGERGTDWQGFIDAIKTDIPKGALWRYGQAGDLPHNDGVIDRTKARQLTKANRGKQVIAYTHHLPEIQGNLETLREMNNGGFTVNLSAENPAMAHEYKKTGLPVVLLMPEGAKNGKLPTGEKVIICPEQTKGIKCINCGLCAKSDRKTIIGFIAHGRSKAKVELIAKG